MKEFLRFSLMFFGALSLARYLVMFIRFALEQSFPQGSKTRKEK